jgi:hypothetical protein
MPLRKLPVSAVFGIMLLALYQLDHHPQLSIAESSFESEARSKTLFSFANHPQTQRFVFLNI